MKANERKTGGNRHKCNQVWTDGSAMNSKDTVQRRAGWGLILSNGIKMGGPLLGENQTVYRAELRAITEALEQTQGEIQVITDCKSVHNGMHGGARNSDLDLWRRVDSETKERRVKVKWMKAHCTEEEAVRRGVDRGDWKGNDEADKAAKEGVKQHSENERAKMLVKLTTTMHSTQCRILMRICGGEETKPSQEVEKTPKRGPNRSEQRMIGPQQPEKGWTTQDNI